MRFCVFYNKDNRDKVMQVITHLCNQKHDFINNPIQHPFFQTENVWPKEDVIFGLPLNVQIEDIIWADGAITVIKKLIIDVEEVKEEIQKTEEKVDEKPNSP